MLNFILTQHCRDEELLRNLVTYLRCGSYIPRASVNAGDFLCRSSSDILDKIIPFFQKYPGPHPPRVGLPPLGGNSWC